MLESSVELVVEGSWLDNLQECIQQIQQEHDAAHNEVNTLMQQMRDDHLQLEIKRNEAVTQIGLVESTTTLSENKTNRLEKLCKDIASKVKVHDEQFEDKLKALWNKINDQNERIDSVTSPVRTEVQNITIKEIQQEIGTIKAEQDAVTKTVNKQANTTADNSGRMDELEKKINAIQDNTKIVELLGNKHTSSSMQSPSTKLRHRKMHQL